MIEDDYIHIDTSNLNLTSLNVKINDLIDSKLSFHIHLSSFAYKKAIPLDMEVDTIGTTTHVGRSTGTAIGQIIGSEDKKIYATGSTTCIIMKPSK